MRLDVQKRYLNGVIIFDCSGPLDSAGGANLREAIVRVFEEGHHAILLNCGGIGPIDSSGLGELVSAYASVVRRGGAVHLLRPGARLAVLLEQTGLDTLFETHMTEQAAVGSFNAAGAARSKRQLTDYLSGGS